MYHYLGCGLTNVWLKNGYEEVRTPYGDGIVIHELEALHDAIGTTIVSREQPLSSEEFRFLRLELNLSQAALAATLGKDEQAVRRWETGKSKMDGAAERLLRVVYKRTKLGAKELKPLLDMLSRIEQPPRGRGKVRLVAESKKKAWSATLKAIAA